MAPPVERLPAALRSMYEPYRAAPGGISLVIIVRGHNAVSLLVYVHYTTSTTAAQVISDQNVT